MVGSVCPLAPVSHQEPVRVLIALPLATLVLHTTSLPVMGGDGSWGGSRVVRYTKEGEFDLEIIFPTVLHVTACTFGGKQPRCGPSLTLGAFRIHFPVRFSLAIVQDRTTTSCM